MSLLPDPFPVPDWVRSLDPLNYPAVFLIDTSWAATARYEIQPGSQTTEVLVGSRPLAGGTGVAHHGEKTLYVVQSVAQGLPDSQVRLVSKNRLNALSLGMEARSNLFDAIISIQGSLKPGDLVVINIGLNNAKDSFACDSLIVTLLQSITDSLGGIVVVSAGNALKPLPHTPLKNGVIVGGVSKTGQKQSRCGKYVTCYGVVPYDLPGYPASVPFNYSSAATAYTAGMVLVIVNYAKSKNRTLTGKDVVYLLKTTGLPLADPTLIGNVSDWVQLRRALDAL